MIMAVMMTSDVYASIKMVDKQQYICEKSTISITFFRYIFEKTLTFLVF